MPSRLALDTPPEVERLQIEAWRSMSSEQKAAIITGLTTAAFNLTLAGIRDRYPNASPAEQHLRLAVLILGPTLAAQIDPACATLGPT